MDEELTTEIIEVRAKRDIDNLDEDLKIPTQASFLMEKSIHENSM